MAVTAETFRLLRSQQEALNASLSRLDGRVQAVWTSIRADLDVANWYQLTPAQRRNLQNALDSQWGRKLETIATETKRTAQQAADAAWANQQALANSQVPMELRFQRPDPTAEEWMRRRTQDRIESRARALSHNTRQALYDELNRGVQVGAHPTEIARRAVRASQAMGEVIDGGMARALNIARTEVLDAYRESAMLTEQANADVLDGWIWVAKLGAHTCRSCWAKHGTVHKLDEPGPIDHPQGRCARVPKTKSWEELGVGGVEEVPSPELDAVKEFKKLTEEQQRYILTDNGWEEWKAGRWPRARWAKLEEPDGWRPFYRAAKAPTPGPRPSKVPPKPSKPSGGTVRPPVPPKPVPKPRSWLDEHAEAKASFSKGAVSTPRTLWDSRNGAYKYGLTETGELTPWYRQGLESVKSAGQVVEREWYRRFEEKMGRMPDSYLSDLRREVERLKMRISRIEKESANAYFDPDKTRLAKLDLQRDEAIKAMENAKELALKTSEANQAAFDAWQAANPNKPGRFYWDMVTRVEGETLKATLADLGMDLGQNLIKWQPMSKAGRSAATLVDRMEQAERLYPKTWVRRAAAKNPRVWLDKAARGYNSRDGLQIVLSDYQSQMSIGAVNNVAIHELGHSMEYVVEGLAQMEWAFLYDRASVVGKDALGRLVRRMPNQTPIYRGTRELGWEDEFKVHYSGKAYDGSAWEVFTTGIESLWAGSGYLDREFRHWLLGVLTVL